LKTAIIIPAFNEAQAIESVVKNALPHADRVIVANNGSTDQTAQIAKQAGADVVEVPISGYGRACLAGIAAASAAELLIFMDGDAADNPDDIPRLISPILHGDAELVIGSRVKGKIEKGALTIQQRWGNALACFLIKRIWKTEYTDLGPFRAITRKSYDQLSMSAPTFGWTVEMQIRAIKANLKITEVPTDYRRRIGTSKISGTVKGVILAGIFILGTIGRECFTSKRY